jgi:hypothetical protein
MIRSPFKFLDPYGPNDSKVFFGRSAEIDELYALVFRTPLLLVYGLTGTGKTSLIDCGLRNRYDGTDWLPFFVRRKDNLNDALRDTLQNALPDDKSRNLTEAVSYLYRFYLRPVYLIFDQFEELFILGTKQEQEEFKQNLKSLLEANLTCKIILVMREEYIGWLYDFERDIPAIFDFRLRVETMKRKNIEEVIEKSCAVFNIALESPENNIDQIYDNVSEGKAVVQLPYLQVYLDTLYRQDIARTYPSGAPAITEQPYPPLTFTGKEIFECGHISGVLENFLREKVSELQESMAQKYPGLPADAVKTVLNSFVTSLGTKKPMPYQLVNKQVQFLSPPEVLRDFNATFIHDTVRNLEQNRVLRDSGETFELAHDTLAHKIFENRSEEEKRRDEVQARLTTSFKEYQESGTHLNAAQIARLEEWLPILRLSPEEAKFVHDSRAAVEAQRQKERDEAEKERRLRLDAEQAKKRAQLFTYIASVVAVLAGIAFFWANYQSSIAKEQRSLAEAATITADSNATVALEQKRLAESSAEFARLQEMRADTQRDIAVSNAEKARIALLNMQQANRNRVDQILVEAGADILALRYDAALSKLHNAAALGQKRPQIGEALLEIVYFFNETGKRQEANKELSTVAALLGKNINPSKADRTSIRTALQNLSPTRFGELETRYYPVLASIKGGGGLSGFKLAKTETTVWQYNLFLNARGKNMLDETGIRRPGWGWAGDNPVVFVSWYDAVLYANWLSEQRGLIPAYTIDQEQQDTNNISDIDKLKWTVTRRENANGFRLPTEAEWAFAAKGGLNPTAFEYAGSNNPDEVAWHSGNAQKHTRPVGSKKPNNLGLYDLSGNVWEWCWDWGASSFGRYRVVRGGSWKNMVSSIRIADGGIRSPDSQEDQYGFRVAQ